MISTLQGSVKCDYFSAPISVFYVPSCVEPQGLCGHLKETKMSKLLTTKEAADLLGISPATLETWRSRGYGGLPFVQVTPKTIRYREEDIWVWVDSRIKGVSHAQR